MVIGSRSSSLFGEAISPLLKTGLIGPEIDGNNSEPLLSVKEPVSKFL